MLKRIALLLGPIVYADLLKIARNKRWYVLRVMLGLLLLYLIGQTYATPFVFRPQGFTGVYTHMELRLIASRLFMTLIICQGVAICCLTPILTAGAIAEEKQRKTLHYLLSSQMSSFEIIIGKFFSRFFVLVLPVAICLPVMVMLGLFGGIDPLIVIVGYGAILSISLFEGSLAILISTLSRRGRDALLMTFILCFVWLIVPWLFEGVMLSQKHPWPDWYRNWIEPINRHFILSSPAVFFQLPQTWRGFARPWVQITRLVTMMVYQVFGAILLLTLAIWQLRPTFRRQDGGPGMRTKLGRALQAKLRAWCPRKPPGDDAMLWKEMTAMPGSVVLSAITYITITVIAICFYETFKEIIPRALVDLRRNGYFNQMNYSRLQLNITLRIINAALLSVVALVLASLSATSISREREDDTWISLVSTPLDGTTILRAKLIGSVWGVRGLLCVIVVVWCFGVGIGSLHPVAILIAAVQLVAFVSFIVGLGTLISLRVQTTMRAVGLTIGILLFLALFMPILIATVFPARGPSAFTGITSFPFLFGAGHISYEDFSRIMGASGGTHSSPRDVLPVCFWGTFLYGIAGPCLLWLCRAQFDRLVDRPRRNG